MFALVMAHSLVRWLVLGTALLAIIGARAAPDRGSGGWGSWSGLLYTVALDVQVLIGLILWVLESGWRLNAFLAYIHPVSMVLALVVAHAGRGRQKRTGVGTAGFWPFIASLLLLLLGIPWMR